MPLPEDLTSENLFDAMSATQDLFMMIRESAGINLSSIVQANNFSGMVSNVFTKKLSEVSRYRLNDERAYPDLLHEFKSTGLEIKATKKPSKAAKGTTVTAAGISSFVTKFLPTATSNSFKSKSRS